MKTWSVAEINSLMNTVETLGPSMGFRKHIENYPERSFQACSHMYYRTRMLRSLEAQRKALNEAPKTSESAGSPVVNRDSYKTTDKENKMSVSTFKKFKNWLSKLFS